jgi:TRAP-type C4-dicarboxylate transport system permease small subunit
VLILFVCLTIGGIKFLELSATQYTSALRMPKWTVYLALPFCGVLMIYETLIRLFNRIFRKEVPN